jgi:hypothetical protein
MADRIRQCICVISAIVITTSGLDAQRRVPGQAQTKQAVNASLKVGGNAYESREPGRCTHAPTASIYSIVSEMWSVQQSAEGRSLALTLWRPKDRSGDMVTLSVSSGKSSHQINTVRGGGATSGMGKVTFEKSGGGGAFTIDAKTVDGVAISGTIKCEAFAPHTAEGGH